jgi:hypothetical protein
LSSLFECSLFARSRFNHLNKIANCPEGARDASGHCWRATNRDVGLHSDELLSAFLELEETLL